ncbi:MAG: NAD(P)/FAD-dependent oxidoreductase [Bacillota bacterium]
MKETQLAVVGAGPAGICGALEAASHGVKVTVIDRADVIGGQLIKQTHKFFGWHKVSAGTRGIIIARNLAEEMAQNPNITFLSDTEVLGYYSDGVLLLETPQGVERLKCDRTLIATGAVERTLLFPGNDLPGVYGAGAVQTLMNVHGVKPGQSVLMVGSGNIGLIVSYQLTQAGVKVAALVEAAPNIGGYAVHASKIRRLGIPILTGHSVKEVHGQEQVEGATIWQLDSKWQGIPGTEQEIDVDVVCIATGLTPLSELLWQAGAEMVYVPELGGFVPLYDENMETTAKGVFVAGDAAGIEEASTAMAGGKLAGLCIAASLGHIQGEAFTSKRDEIRSELDGLRSGPTSAKVVAGHEQVRKLLEKRVSS